MEAALPSERLTPSAVRITEYSVSLCNDIPIAARMHAAMNNERLWFTKRGRHEVPKAAAADR